VKRLLWVDTNEIRPGGRPLLVVDREDDETRPNDTAIRGSEIRIDGPSVLRFDPDNTGLARVWIETQAETVVVDPKPAYRQ